MKNILLALLMMLGICAVAQPAFTSGDPVGKAVIELHGGKKGDVTFPHKTHQATLKDCSVCHIMFSKKEGAIQQMIMDGKLKQKQVMTYCQNCHRDIQKKGMKSGPTSCSKCHKKE